MELEKLILSLGKNFRKLTLHSENPKHPLLIWHVTPNQHYSPYKKGVRGKTPCEAVQKLIDEIKKVS